MNDKDKAAKWDKYQAKFKEYAKRRAVKIALLANKAKAAGIVVTEAEIDAELAKKAKK